MTQNTTPTNENIPAGEQPVALLFVTDLMFGVQLQTIARHAGYRCVSVRSGATLPAGNILVVDIAARGDCEAVISEGREKLIPVIAFGPHVDVDARKRAKAAGASRLLANSNLAERLPGILLALREQGSTEVSDTETIEDED